MRLCKTMVAIMAVVIGSGCSTGDEPTTEPPPAEANKAPRDFKLSGIANNATDVALNPTFTWDQAIDPDGDKVTYDLYMGSKSGNLERIATNISGTEYEITERLSLVTNYMWKVVASDGEGGETESESFHFRTRSLNVTQVIEDAVFDPGAHHKSIVFQDKIWVTGGWKHDPQPYEDEHGVPQNDSFREDVWTSKDGVSWLQVPSLPKSAVGHQLLIYKDNLWSIGGDDGITVWKEIENHVFYTEDGTSWITSNTGDELPAITEHAAVVFDQKMVVIGGHNDLIDYSKVWTSTNGENWESFNISPISTAGGSSLIFQEKIWLINRGAPPGHSGIHFSEDGKGWTEVITQNPLVNSLYHSSFVYDDKIWVIGGRIIFEGDVTGTIWYSENGIDWFVAGELEEPLYRQSAVVFNDRVFLIGGNTIGENGYDQVSGKILILE